MTQYLLPEKNFIFSKKIELENYGECIIRFYLDNQRYFISFEITFEIRFYACIKPVIKSEITELMGKKDSEKKYVLLFDSYDGK